MIDLNAFVLRGDGGTKIAESVMARPISGSPYLEGTIINRGVRPTVIEISPVSSVLIAPNNAEAQLYLFESISKPGVMFKSKWESTSSFCLTYFDLYSSEWANLGESPSGYYWRLNPISNNGGSQTHIGFIKFITKNGRGTHNFIEVVDPTPNVALALNGDLSSNGLWVASSTEKTLSVQFLDGETITGVEIWPGFDNTKIDELPKDFNIEYSPDGVEWFVKTKFTGITDWVAGEPKLFSVQDGQEQSDLSYHDLLLSYEPTILYNPAGGHGGTGFGSVAGTVSAGDMDTPFMTVKNGVTAYSRKSQAFYTNSRTVIPDTDYTMVFMINTAVTTFSTFGGQSNGAGSGSQPGVMYTEWTSGDKLILTNNLAGGTNLGWTSAVPLCDGAWHVVCFTRKQGIREVYVDGELVDRTVLTSSIFQPVVSVDGYVTVLKESDGGYPFANETGWVGVMTFFPHYVDGSEAKEITQKMRNENGLP